MEQPQGAYASTTNAIFAETADDVGACYGRCSRRRHVSCRQGTLPSARGVLFYVKARGETSCSRRSLTVEAAHRDQQKERTKMRFAIILGLFALILTTSARADYAVMVSDNGFCRVYADPRSGEPNGAFLPFWSPMGWIYSFPTWDTANMAMQQAVAEDRCHW
jgi:hypothetical protein